MVKVRTTVPEQRVVLPKSVWSVLLGVASPSAIETLLPCTFISGRVTSQLPAGTATICPLPHKPGFKQVATVEYVTRAVPPVISVAEGVLVATFDEIA